MIQFHLEDASGEDSAMKKVNHEKWDFSIFSKGTFFSKLYLLFHWNSRLQPGNVKSVTECGLHSVMSRSDFVVGHGHLLIGSKKLY